jgi:hypothetical protein
LIVQQRKRFDWGKCSGEPGDCWNRVCPECRSTASEETLRDKYVTQILGICNNTNFSVVRKYKSSLMAGIRSSFGLVDSLLKIK